MYTTVTVNPLESLSIIGSFLGLAITLYSIVASAIDSYTVVRWERIEEAIDERRDRNRKSDRELRSSILDAVLESFVTSPFRTN